MIGLSTPHGEGVAQLAFFGLYALQHRGQEAAGIAVSDGQRARIHKDAGLVSRIFTPEHLAPLGLAALAGVAAAAFVVWYRRKA